MRWPASAPPASQPSRNSIAPRASRRDRVSARLARRRSARRPPHRRRRSSRRSRRRAFHGAGAHRRRHALRARSADTAGPAAPAAQRRGDRRGRARGAGAAPGGVLRHRLSPHPAGHGAGLCPAAPLRGGGRPPLRVSRPLLRVHRLGPARASTRARPRAARSSRIWATAPACAPWRAGRASPRPWASRPSTDWSMGTRCGAIDPGVLLYLMERGMDAARPGEPALPGVGAARRLRVSRSDMRDAARKHRPAGGRGHRSLRLPHRARARLHAAALGGLDALVFTGGIGENAAAIRERVCRDAAWLGIRARRRRPTPRAAPASAPRTAAWRHGSFRRTRS